MFCWLLLVHYLHITLCNQEEIKNTIAFFFEIVPTEKDDITLRGCIDYYPYEMKF